MAAQHDGSKSGSAGVTDADVIPWVFPGDWEPHSSVWLAWQEEDNKRGRPISLPLFQMIGGLHGHMGVSLLVQDEKEERLVQGLAKQQSVPLDHVTFYHIQHVGHWMRDMGPQFVRSLDGKRLAIVDWNFNAWGHEEPTEAGCRVNDAVHRTIAQKLNVPLIPVATSDAGVRMIHEGGSVAHNGRGTMVAVESVAMQRNLGPNRFFPGTAPVGDLSSPTTYQQTPEWAACRERLTLEYARSLGVKKLIWLPTGVMEDDGTYRGPVGRQHRIAAVDGQQIDQQGAYTLYTTNGHADEFCRFIAEDTVLLAQSTVTPLPAQPTDLQRLSHYIEQQNLERMERCYQILVNSTTAEGKPIRVQRMPTAFLLYELLQSGDPIYDFYRRYKRWENAGDSLKEGQRMLAVLPTSYVNYFPSHDVILVPKYHTPERPDLVKKLDDQAAAILSGIFTGRKVVQVAIENINLGGGGIHCSVQQQPALL